MADSKKSERASADSNSGRESETFPELVGRLGDELSTLLDLRLSLLKVEIKEDVDAYIRRSVTIAAGAGVVLVGFCLFNVAVAFFISSLFAELDLSQSSRYGVGFGITGATYLIVGAIVVFVTKSRLARQGLVPTRSVAELEKDRELVRTVIQG